MPLKLFYSHNIVTKTYAAIFVNTHTRDLEWDKAVEKGEACRHLFEKTLEFEQVEVFTNLAKFRMIEVFEKIQRMVNKFESTRGEQEKICIGVVWIGHTLYLNSHHKELVKPKDGPPLECADQTICPKQHGLSVEGEPISVYEYCSRLCKGKNSHVFHILDWWSIHIGQLTAEHIDLK